MNSPAVGRLFVLSPEAYNRKTGLFLACPMTSRIKGYPFEVTLPEGLPVSGVILADQIKSLDWKARKAEFATETPEPVVDEVLALVLPLIENEGEPRRSCAAIAGTQPLLNEPWRGLVRLMRFVFRTGIPQRTRMQALWQVSKAPGE